MTALTPAQRARGLSAACAALALATLVIARMLTPDAAGVGTHTQLGLPACGFLYWTGLPCPACGLTTAFAHMARLQFTSALDAHVLGPPLFVLVALALFSSTWAFARAVPPLQVIGSLRVTRLAAIIGLAVMLCWITRIAALLLT